MTQEEKAKRYDKALEIAKKNHITAQEMYKGYPIGIECFKNTLERIFPELKESEDESIRKELTEFLKSASGGFLDTAIQCKTFGKWAAWLEKQGKQFDDNIITSSDERIRKAILEGLIAKMDSFNDIVHKLKRIKEKI